MIHRGDTRHKTMLMHCKGPEGPSYSISKKGNEVLDKITSPIRLHRSKIFSKNISKNFRSFSKTFRLFRDFEIFSRNRSRRDDSFGPKIVEFRAILAIFRPFEDLDVRPDVQRGRNWRCNLFQHAIMIVKTCLWDYDKTIFVFSFSSNVIFVR